MNRNEYRQMLLSGTVCFPPTFPQVAELRLEELASPPTAQGPSERPAETILVVTQSAGPRVRIKRSVRLCEVRAVFIPRDVHRVNYDDGLWLLADEVGPGLEIQLNNCAVVKGIAFVPEAAQTLLKMTAGMTAGESIQYYPPLPRDPSANHYTAWPPRQQPDFGDCVPRKKCPDASPPEDECVVAGPYCEDDYHDPYAYGHSHTTASHNPFSQAVAESQMSPLHMSPVPCEECDQ